MQHKKRITFSDWIAEYGVRKLARHLGLDPSAVSKWKCGKSQPSLPHAAVILKLAKGKLKPEDLQVGGAA